MARIVGRGDKESKLEVRDEFALQSIEDGCCDASHGCIVAVGVEVIIQPLGSNHRRRE